MNKLQRKVLSSSRSTDEAPGAICRAYSFWRDVPACEYFPVFVPEADRGSGVGRQLIQALLSYLEDKQYLSVSAKVAAELPANAFWSSLKFETVATKSGGASRGRTINIRARQFNTPALFGYDDLIRYPPQ